MEFKTSKNFPWFIFNNEEKVYGFDADLIVDVLINGGQVTIYSTADEKVLEALKGLIQRVIDDTKHYQDKTMRDPAKRFQIIINGNILEVFLDKTGYFIRNSDGKWLINSSYETGTDFTGLHGTRVEAKVYYSYESMYQKVEEANLGNRYIFHDAELVCCYLISSRSYQWLHKKDEKYEDFNDEGLRAWTKENLPATLPICRCVEDKINNTWTLVSWYRN